jgi:hypothetical protein
MVSFLKSKKQCFVAYSPIILCLIFILWRSVRKTTIILGMKNLRLWLCYSLTIICCCQVQDYIYWIISTENDHRHHHKFIKYEKRLRKEGNMPRLTYQAKYLPLQRDSSFCGSWAKEKVSTRGRKRNLTDSERKRNRSAVSFKWNKCRIYVGDQLDRWNELSRWSGKYFAW